MERNTAVTRPEPPVKATQAQVVKALKSNTDCTTILKKKSSESSTEFSVKGKVAMLISKQSRTVESIELFNLDSPAADRAWKEFHLIEDTLEELEASLEVAA